MSLRSFNEWKKFNEGKKNKGKEGDCPRPNNPEFCRKWNLYLKGQGPDPFLDLKKPKRLGHWEGRRGGDTPTAKSVYRQKQREGEGRHKWRPSKEY